MTDPAASIDVGAWHLANIAQAFKRQGFDIEWRDPAFAGLVLLAYTADATLVPGIAGGC